MTSLLLYATLLCPIEIPLPNTSVRVTAEYYHEYPQGEDYTYEMSQVMLHSGSGFIECEGHPWHVTASINGIQVANCAGQDAIFIDGFESSDARFWR